MTEPPTGISSARFDIGDIIHHRRFDYRGVIIDIDARFSLSDEWYQTVARSRPPKDQPWYHVLVDGGSNTTYVAERHLQADASAAPIEHPLVAEIFNGLVDGRYVGAVRNN